MTSLEAAAHLDFMADTLELNVTGMSCDGCSGSVNTVVSKLAGVEKVVAEHQPTNKVTVTGTALDRAAIVEAITKAGFTVEA